MKHSPKQSYEEIIKEFTTELHRRKKKSNVYEQVKLISFILFLFFLYKTYSSHIGWYVFGIVFLVIVYMIFYFLDTRSKKRIKLLMLQEAVCRRELRYLKGELSDFENGREYQDPHHNFSYDLDLFGESSIFQRINRTITKSGSDALAYLLTHLSEDKRQVVKNQAAVEELKNMTEWRIKFFSNESPKQRIRDLANFYCANYRLNIFLKVMILPFVSMTITFSLLFLSFFNIVPISAFWGMFVFQIIMGFTVSKTTTRICEQINVLHREYLGYISLLKDIEQQTFQSEEIKEIKDTLFYKNSNCIKIFKKLSFILNLFDIRNNALAYLSLNGFFMLDIYLVREYAKWCHKYMGRIDLWIDAIGKIDALASLANFSYNHPEYTHPEIMEDKAENLFEAINITHPYLSAEKSVSNSFTLKKNNIAIVTGANMAGKSTFLRMIGVNYVLACCGAPVSASFFKFTVVSLFSSMRTQDNLSKHESYFSAELFRLKQLLDHVKRHPYTLIILDEILKGTNSKDKQEGSMLFLEAIAKYNISAIIATHDLALAELEKKNEKLYQNYCFEIELSTDIKYTYKIKKGIAQNLNASFLLSKILKSF